MYRFASFSFGTAWLAAVFVLSGVVRPISASCVEGVPPDYHFDVSVAVFSGEAVAQTLVSAEPWDGFEIMTTFKVDKQWKGEPAEEVEVRTCGPGSPIPCSDPYTFKVGAKYVVFAWDVPLKTTGCSLTGTLEESTATVAWLDRRPVGQADELSRIDVRSIAGTSSAGLRGSPGIP